MYCFHHQGRYASQARNQPEGNAACSLLVSYIDYSLTLKTQVMFLQNVGGLLLIYTALQSRRQDSFGYLCLI
jgi:hypothetical protein